MGNLFGIISELELLCETPTMKRSWQSSGLCYGKAARASQKHIGQAIASTKSHTAKVPAAAHKQHKPCLQNHRKGLRTMTAGTRGQ